MKPAATSTARPATPLKVKRWALIVGISRYRQDDWNLRYAHRDAQALADLIRSPAGGGYAAERVHLLTDEQATTAALTHGLRTFLKKPAEDDIVMLYFACHGCADGERSDNHYLLTHDTDPKDIAATALPMREINFALQKTLYAKRIMVFVDSCHSGELTLEEGTRSRDIGGSAAFLKHLPASKPGGKQVAFLTSARENQKSYENERWGGGHGVFTYYLLRGMSGEADGYPNTARNHEVTVGELFNYVINNVKKDPFINSRQHPTKARRKYDENMVVTETGSLWLEEEIKQAQLLDSLARRVQEPERFRDAARRHAVAAVGAQRIGEDTSELLTSEGSNHLFAGDLDKAVNLLERVLKQHPDRSLPRTHFYLAIAEARQLNYDRAVAALSEVVSSDNRHENSAWIANYLTWLQQRSNGKRRALLIGVDDYRMPSMQLEGCANDVHFLKEQLSRKNLFDDVRILLNEQATHDNILKAIAELGEGLGEHDQLWVSYSGHSFPEAHPNDDDLTVHDAYLIVHDTIANDEGIENSIGAFELHAAMKALPTPHNTLVLDTHPSFSLKQLAGRDANYTLLLGSDNAELAYENKVEIDGESKRMGLFTAALVQSLDAANFASLNYRHLMAETRARMTPNGQRQTPLIVGDKEQLVFGIQDPFLAALDLAKLRDHTRLNAKVLNKLAAHINKVLKAPYPEFHLGVGRTQFHLGDLEAAAVSLATARRQRSGSFIDCSLLQTRVHLARHADRDAMAAITSECDCIEALIANEHSNGMTAIHSERSYAEAFLPVAKSVIARLERLRKGRRRVLLVGIDHYADASLNKVHGAVNDIEAMARLLGKNGPVQAADIVCLKDAEASRAAVLAAFQQLCKAARGSACYFHFAGNGSFTEAGLPTLICADSRTGGVADLELAELARLAQDRNLVSVLDAGWNPQSKYNMANSSPLQGSRYAPPGEHSLGISRTQVRKDTETDDAFKVGAVTILNPHAVPASFHRVPDSRPMPDKMLETEASTRGRGVLSLALHDAAEELVPDSSAASQTLSLCISDWLSQASMRLTQPVPPRDAKLRASNEPASPVYALGEVGTRRLFDCFLIREAADAELEKLEQAPLRDLLVLLEAVVESHDRSGDLCAWGRLNMGVACEQLGNYPRAIRHMKKAVKHFETSQESTHDAELSDQLNDARYLLGRTLYQARKELPLAVYLLSTAREIDPNDPGRLLYLGLAMSEMNRLETPESSRELLQRYLNLDAPLGRAEQVTAMLRQDVPLRDNRILSAAVQQPQPTTATVAG